MVIHGFGPIQPLKFYQANRTNYFLWHWKDDCEKAKFGLANFPCIKGYYNTKSFPTLVFEYIKSYTAEQSIPCFNKLYAPHILHGVIAFC